MTECERIIKNKILPKSFFKSEEICDYFVDEKRKKVWAIEIDLLLKFNEICRKHNLKYFLMFGSLLGAVRHKGFIPWDDDMDVCMLRDDYEKLLLLNKEFNSPYFLQTPYTDEGYYYSFIRLRNSNTTGLSKKFRFNSFNQGIMLDIFPLDAVNPAYIEENYNIIKNLVLGNSACMRKNNPYLDEHDMQLLKKYIDHDPIDSYTAIQKIASQYNNVETNFVSVSVFTVYPYLNNIFEKADFADCESINFYGYKFPIPIGYDKVLKTIYGNYMEFPPVEKRGAWHSDLFFDPDSPYVQHLGKEELYKKDTK